LQSIQEISHVFFDLAHNVGIVPSLPIHLPSLRTHSVSKHLKLKRQYEDMLDAREDGVIDIAPNIHMLASVVLLIARLLPSD